MVEIAEAERSVRSLSDGPIIIYDGACPFCSRYVRWTRLGDSIGPVRAVDARSLPAEALASIGRGYNLDQGMIFSYAGRTYWGADAIHALSLLSGEGVFTRISAAIFRHRWLARLLYPALRCGRNLAILMGGRGKIHSMD